MRFATDATLGKLGRYLRAAGFDTLCQHQSRRPATFMDRLDARRIIMTRTTDLRRRFRHRPLIFIRDNDPWRQLEQVVAELAITQSDMRPLRRCLECNTETSPLDRQAARGRVPVYVWQHHHTFKTCSRCRRIYWAGSHHQRMSKRLAAIFTQKKGTFHEH